MHCQSRDHFLNKGSFLRSSKISFECKLMLLPFQESMVTTAFQNNLWPREAAVREDCRWSRSTDHHQPCCAIRDIQVQKGSIMYPYWENDHCVPPPSHPKLARSGIAPPPHPEWRKYAVQYCLLTQFQIFSFADQTVQMDIQ